MCLLVLSGCSQSSSSSTLSVAGSTTVLPIAEMAAEGYETTSDMHVLVSGLGSSAGIEAVMSGTADIATSSRNLTAEEATHDLVPTVIAHDGIAIIVNPTNPVNNLSSDQLRAIYAGTIKNWRDVGGPDVAIQVVNRDEASGTREAFRTLVMGNVGFDKAAAVLPGTGQVRDVVSRTPGAVGYISIGFVKSDHATTSVRSVCVDGIEATEDNVSAGTYPISRDLYFFTKGEPQGTARDFIAYVQSDEMDHVIRDAGYLPAHSTTSDGSTTSTTSAESTNSDQTSLKERETK